MIQRGSIHSLSRLTVSFFSAASTPPNKMMTGRPARLRACCASRSSVRSVGTVLLYSDLAILRPSSAVSNIAASQQPFSLRPADRRDTHKTALPASPRRIDQGAGLMATDGSRVSDRALDAIGMLVAGGRPKIDSSQYLRSACRCGGLRIRVPVPAETEMPAQRGPGAAANFWRKAADYSSPVRPNGQRILISCVAWAVARSTVKEIS